MKRVGPPEYRKDGEAGSRRSLLMVRQDRYAVDENNHRLIPKDFGLEVEFSCGLEVVRQKG